MPIEQHYYTSWVPESGQSGFQTRAYSANLSAAQIKELESHIGYRVSADMLLLPFTDHPISMKYMLKTDGEAMLMHIASCGTDEVGRDGNFFAHSLIGTFDDMTDAYAPILLWNSDFWQRKDNNPGLSLMLDSLLQLPSVSSFDYSAMYAFVSTKRVLFASLLSAIISFSLTNRRIVIADTDDHVALWIAAICHALPSHYASTITFSTYQPNFRQSPFQITGVTPDTSFISSDYQSYFVIDAKNQQESSIVTGEYADFVARNFSEDFQNDVLVEFKSDFMAYLGAKDQAQFAMHIDSFLNLWGKERQNGLSLVFNSKTVIDHANAVLPQLTSLATRHPVGTSIGYLQSLLNALCDAIRNDANSLNQVQTLVSTMREFRRYDHDPASTVNNLLDLIMDLIQQSNLDFAESISQTLLDIYDGDVIRAVLCDYSILTKASDAVQGNKPQEKVFLWANFGRYLSNRPDTEGISARLIQGLLDMVHQPVDFTRITYPKRDQVKLIDFLLQSNINTNFALGVACQYAMKKHSMSFVYIYYRAVMHLVLADRRQMQDKWWGCTSTQDIGGYELAFDLTRCETDTERMNLLGQWDHTVSAETFPSVLVSATRMYFTQVERYTLAIDLLLSPRLINAGYRHKKDWCQWLFDMVGNGDISLNSKLEEIYDQIISGQIPVQLSQQQKQAYLVGRTLKKDVLNDDDLRGLRTYFRDIEDTKEYTAIIDRFLKKFFVAPRESVASHARVVYMIYSMRHDRAFWENYWYHFQRNLLELQNIDAIVEIMDTWMNNQYVQLEGYLNQSYLMQLPGQLNFIDNDKRFKRIRTKFVEVVEQMKWANLVIPYISNTSKRSNFIRNLWSNE